MNFQVQHLGGVVWGGHSFIFIHTSVVAIVVSSYVDNVKDLNVPDQFRKARPSIQNAPGKVFI